MPLHHLVRGLAIPLVALGFGVAAPETRAATVFWPDGFVSRLEALALLQSLNAALLSHDSATLTLDNWCKLHRLADPATIVALRDRSVTKPATPEQLHLLDVGSADAVRYRRVKLMCGDLVLSEADNWYVPSRLTAAMNDQLDHSDIAFGRAVQALRFRRRTLSATLLWEPLPEGWEMNPEPVTSKPGRLEIPYRLLEHRAVLTLPDGTPFSEVVETYTASVLAFPAPSP